MEEEKNFQIKYHKYVDIVSYIINTRKFSKIEKLEFFYLTTDEMISLFTAFKEQFYNLEYKKYDTYFKILEHIFTSTKIFVDSKEDIDKFISIIQKNKHRIKSRNENSNFTGFQKYIFSLYSNCLITFEETLRICDIDINNQELINNFISHYGIGGNFFTYMKYVKNYEDMESFTYKMFFNEIISGNYESSSTLYNTLFIYRHMSLEKFSQVFFNGLINNHYIIIDKYFDIFIHHMFYKDPDMYGQLEKILFYDTLCQILADSIIYPAGGLVTDLRSFSIFFFHIIDYLFVLNLNDYNLDILNQIDAAIEDNKGLYLACEKEVYKNIDEKIRIKINSLNNEIKYNISIDILNNFDVKINNLGNINYRYIKQIISVKESPNYNCYANYITSLLTLLCPNFPPDITNIILQFLFKHIDIDKENNIMCKIDV